MTFLPAALMLAAATSPPAPVTIDSPSIQERLAFVRDFRVDITEGQTQAAYIQTHHELLDLYWRHLANDAASTSKATASAGSRSGTSARDKRNGLPTEPALPWSLTSKRYGCQHRGSAV